MSHVARWLTEPVPRGRVAAFRTLVYLFVAADLVIFTPWVRTHADDRETGEPLEVVGRLLPLPPSRSRLPWAVETLRFCNWCDQPAQRDLNDCPTCGRRMSALPRVVEE